MSGALHAALGRALSFVSERSAPSLLEALLSRMAWELQALVSAQCIDVAILIRPREGAAIAGRSREEPALPTPTIIGIVVEAGTEGASVRIKDHAIDSARLVSAGCRSSIVVRLSLPEGMLQGGESWLWMGLVCAAAPAHVEQAREVARAVSEWASANWGAVSALERAKRELLEALGKLRAATAVAHDARAPLGAMRAMLKNGELGSDDAEILQAQFGYLEALLERLSPQALGERRRVGEECDACAVARRVAQRLGPTVSLKAPPAPVWCAFPELELERVLSNIGGNAVRHSGHGPVLLEVLERPGALGVSIFVRDSGPGFCPEVLERFAAGAFERLPSASGWGVGLSSSRASVEESGGILRLLHDEGGGGLVEVRLKRVRGSAAYRPSSGDGVLELGASDVRYGTGKRPLCIIDDDVAHAESLAKLLGARGVVARCFATVGDALEELAQPGAYALCDAQMPDGGAQRLLESLRKRNLKPRVCVMSGAADDDVLYRLAALGAESFLLKPIECPEIERWLARSLP